MLKRLPMEGETNYYVSDAGEVLSDYIRADAEIKTIDGKEYAIRKQHTGADGYKSVTIRHKKYPVHRLVATSFIERPMDPAKKYVNHIDGDKSNNHVGNLEWVTAQENAAHAIKLGLRKTNSQDYWARTVCSVCHKPMTAMWCKIEEFADKRVMYRVHGAPTVIKIPKEVQPAKVEVASEPDDSTALDELLGEL